MMVRRLVDVVSKSNEPVASERTPVPESIVNMPAVGWDVIAYTILVPVACMVTERAPVAVFSGTVAAIAALPSLLPAYQIAIATAWS